MGQFLDGGANISLLCSAFGEAAGPAVVLDSDLSVVHCTAAAERILGESVRPGAHMPDLLARDGDANALVELLTPGRTVSAQLVTPHAGARQRRVTVMVHAYPLAAQASSAGWLLQLKEQEVPALPPESVVARWGISTRNPVMKQLLANVERVADSAVPVVVEGENGSGRELLARAIHQASKRAKQPFRTVNCATLGRAGGTLPVSSWFAAGGSLFLDEVTELPAPQQAELSHALGVAAAARLAAAAAAGGAGTPNGPMFGREGAGVRVLASTSHRLQQAVASGRLRADLQGHLQVLSLWVPPLRERPDDIESLAWGFITRRHASLARRIQRISDSALKAMIGYSWPGNVRELENAVEYALTMGEGPTLTSAQLPPEVCGAQRLIGINVAALGSRRLVEEAQRIVRALESHGGHRGRAAASLGMSRTTLWRRMQSFGLN